MKLWGIAAVVLALSGCGVESTDNADGDKTIIETVDDQTMRLDLAGGQTKGVAVWFHGQGGDADTRMNEDWLNRLRIDGWAVASADLNGNHWGNASSVAATKALVDWAYEKTGHKPALYVAGSMGGLASLNSMIDGVHHPKCWYGTMPVVDQSTVANVPDSAAQISDAFGGPVPASLVPAKNLGKLPAAKYRVLSSPEDTWVPAETNANALVRGLTGPGVQVSTLATKGEHGHPSHFNASDLANFAASCV